MRTIVTGAAGFIGSTLVDRLLAEGHQVLGIDNLSTGQTTNLEHACRRYGRSGHFVFNKVDVRASALHDLVAATRPDVVYHLAAQVDLRASVADPQHDASCNVLGTINVLEACRTSGVRKIVYAASGGSRYGAPTSLPVNEHTPPDPLSPYAAAKYAGEVYLNAYADMYGIVPISLGLANVYGPRQNPHGEAGVIAIFSSSLLAGRPVTVFGDGTASRDYVYVDDVVEAFVRAGRCRSAAPGIYNIGTGQQTTTNDVHRMISEALGGTPPPRYAPARTGEVQAIALDVTKARDHLGWVPSVDVERGIKNTLHWLRGVLEPEPLAVYGA
ncbi:NAD-dependent epimerase/dehydratase family protein [Mycobacterium sp. SMC-4]|uniref:NAD-dependent epimerase/dehydratase family protein n=1 Tax=Mycobacterium sp. SMC-4 TaxID=2857059 RepID=UPI003D056921